MDSTACSKASHNRYMVDNWKFTSELQQLKLHIILTWNICNH